ncbi:HWE histidine kinase domain-containing protein [Pelagibacterium sp. H642]|uniref:sensor histidine kinase n=1 Tax=Pelagibacterium sp. H642 TaxID=1881069 RepID=UPI002814F08A|nr:HWE histidine kinase domain-containing protein [Pelagibacterium sp. H642]WMT92912.1 ATP-binding protein [Pelagibacterium sp. H642]
MKHDFFFLQGGGRSAEIIAATDWVRTELGPIEAWTPALRIAVGLMLSSSFPKAIAWGNELVTLHNDAFKPILGSKPEAIGRSFAEVWSEAWPEIGPIAEKAFAGHPTFIENFPLRINRNGFDEQAFFTFCYSPIRNETGRVVGIMDTVIETTGTVFAQRQLEVTNSELAHRMRNLVALVRALARQSLAGTTEIEAQRDTFLDRLQALGNAHTLLASDRHPEATISQLIDAVLAPRVTDQARISISGPEVLLASRPALTLSLALNELFTNAIKYGCLSNDRGRVEIRWKIDKERFELLWQEQEGPPVKPPSQKGFGSQLIEDYVAWNLRGEAILHHLPEGVRYELRTPLITLTD